MHVNLSEKQLTHREEIVEFARSELGAKLREFDRSSTFPREDWERCAAKGLMGTHVPEVYGGKGLDAVTTVLEQEAIGYGCQDNGLTLGIGAQIWSVQEPILVYGTEEQKKKYLPRLCSGELIGCHGVTEETAGSDALSMKTTAVKTEGGYLLKGRKIYVGLAPLADVVIVLANADPESGKWGVSAFIVESGFKGFSQSEPRLKTGTRTNPLGDLILEDCFVPEKNMLGQIGIGRSLFLKTIAWERAFIHAGHLGAMQFLFEQTVAHAKERQQFGQPIGKFQSVANRVADMRVRLETSRLLMYKTAAMKDAGEDATMECAMTNLHVAESLLECATDAVRVHGGRGFLEEYDVERQLRDSMGGVIYAGTSDIQRNLIVRLLGL